MRASFVGCAPLQRVSAAQMPQRARTTPRCAHSSAPQRQTHARRWRIALSACCVHALHVSVIYFGPATLLSPMRQELGLTIAQVSAPLNVFRVINCFLLVPTGMFVDRVGAYRVLWPGLAIGAMLAFLLPLCTSMWQLALLQGAFALSKLLGGLASMQVIVMRTFAGAPDAGSAQAYTLSGWSAAGAIAPALIGALEARFGWRKAFTALAALFACVGLPLAYVFLRRPLDHSADTASAPQSALAASHGAAERGAREAVLPRRYAALLGVVAAMSVSLHVVIDHLVLYLREDAAFSFENATKYLSLLNVFGLLAKLIAGPLGDRLPHAPLLSAFSLLALTSSLAFAYAMSAGAMSGVVVTAFTALYGLSYSAVITLVYTALPEFGLQAAATRANLNLVVQLAFGIVGSQMASWMRVSSGSYVLPFFVGACCWCAAFVFIGVFAALGKRGASGGLRPQVHK